MKPSNMITYSLKCVECHRKREVVFYLIKRYAMKVYVGVEVYLRASFTSAPKGSKWSAPHPSRLTPGGQPSPLFEQKARRASTSVC